MSAKPDHDKSGHEVFGPDDDRYDAIGASEARHASGFVKVAGKHKSADGLLSRGGYRRVLPDYEDAEWLDLEKPERLAELEEIKSKVLHGRNATIFEQLVLAPLRGERGKTVEELAEQFNKSPDRIYKVKHKAKARVMTFVARE